MHSHLGKLTSRRSSSGWIGNTSLWSSPYFSHWEISTSPLCEETLLKGSLSKLPLVGSFLHFFARFSARLSVRQSGLGVWLRHCYVSLSLLWGLPLLLLQLPSLSDRVISFLLPPGHGGDSWCSFFFSTKTKLLQRHLSYILYNIWNVHCLHPNFLFCSHHLCILTMQWRITDINLIEWSCQQEYIIHQLSIHALCNLVCIHFMYK